jgi:predicted neuraminidase
MSAANSESGSRDRHFHFEFSHDGGQSWERSADVNPGIGFAAIEPTILFPTPGRIEVLARTSQGVIAMTWSSDNGHSWTPLAATTLPNPNSAVAGINLADGRLLLVYNHSAHLPKWSGHGYRYPLDIAMSCDGLDWEHVLTLETAPKPESTDHAPVDLAPPTIQQEFDVWGAKGFSYPSVLQAADGLVHITYTWNRKMIKYVIVDPRKLRFDQNCGTR